MAAIPAATLLTVVAMTEGRAVRSRCHCRSPQPSQPAPPVINDDVAARADGIPQVVQLIQG